MQSKIHKEGNSGMPVIGSLNCHMSIMFKYVDFHLQPIVNTLNASAAQHWHLMG